MNSWSHSLQQGLLWLLGLGFALAIFFGAALALTPPAAPPPTPSASPSPTALVFPTVAPSLTPAPAPTATTRAALTSAPSPTSLPPCEWTLASDKVAMPPATPANCFADSLRFGISQEDDALLFYTASQRQVGYFGVSKPLGETKSITLKVDVNALQTSRFMLAIASLAETPNDNALGLRIHSDDGKALVFKLVSFSAGGREREIAISPAANYPTWGRNFDIRFDFDGAKTKIYVNEILIGQWNLGFSQRYLFVGYQSMPVSGVPIQLDVATRVEETP